MRSRWGEGFSVLTCSLYRQRLCWSSGTESWRSRSSLMSSMTSASAIMTTQRQLSTWYWVYHTSINWCSATSSASYRSHTHRHTHRHTHTDSNHYKYFWLIVTWSEAGGVNYNIWHFCLIHHLDHWTGFLRESVQPNYEKYIFPFFFGNVSLKNFFISSQFVWCCSGWTGFEALKKHDGDCMTMF